MIDPASPSSSILDNHAALVALSSALTLFLNSAAGAMKKAYRNGRGNRRADDRASDEHLVELMTQKFSDLDRRLGAIEDEAIAARTRYDETAKQVAGVMAKVEVLLHRRHVN